MTIHEVELRPLPGTTFQQHSMGVHIRYPAGSERALVDYLRMWIDMYIEPLALAVEDKALLATVPQDGPMETPAGMHGSPALDTAGSALLFGTRVKGLTPNTAKSIEELPEAEFAALQSAVLRLAEKQRRARAIEAEKAKNGATAAPPAHS